MPELAVKVLLAPDAFKGTLAAAAAAEILRRGLEAARPELRLELHPLADGGEGTAAVLVAALGGSWRYARVAGPLPGQRVRAAWGWVPATDLAVLDMAAASGLPRVPPERRDPLSTTTRGTGELIRAAAGEGARRIWVGAGGSATVDGGVGAAAALGWRFLDRAGRAIPGTGGGLERLHRIEPPAADERLPPLEVLCDVEVPLLGERGAARRFGPQKGADPEAVERLEAALARLADIIRRDLGRDVAELPGAGAAGGLGAGAAAFLGARLVAGCSRVLEATGFEGRLAGADWVVTGEGRADATSLDGKVLSGVLAAARRTGTRVALVAGSLALTERELERQGVRVAVSLADQAGSVEAAMEEPETWLLAAAGELAGRLAGG